jgi:DNA-binding CsgD family transcriptional regulator
VDRKRNGYSKSGSSSVTTPTLEELTGALAEVRRQIHNLQDTEQFLEYALGGSGSKGVDPIPLASPAPRSRPLNAEKRMNVSIAQEKRWAAYRAGAAEPPKTGEPTKLSGTLNYREQTVLRGILDGLTNSRIAEGMGISVTYVKAIIQGLFTRTGVRTRTQLVRLACEGSFGDLRNGDPGAKQPVPPETQAVSRVPAG